MAIAAVNQGKVLRILEKPLDGEATREALREALAMYRSQALERAVNEAGSRPARGAGLPGARAQYAARHRARLREFGGGEAHPRRRGRPGGVAQFREDHPGELVTALERAERRALLPVAGVHLRAVGARRLSGRRPQSITASSLVEALLDEFPFEENERSCVTLDVRHDFRLPGRRDLLYLVLCTLAKNALIAMRGRPSRACGWRWIPRPEAPSGAPRLGARARQRPQHPRQVPGQAASR